MATPNITADFAALKAALLATERDVAKVAKGNAAATRRVRRSLQELRKQALAIRLQLAPSHQESATPTATQR